MRGVLRGLLGALAGVIGFGVAGAAAAQDAPSLDDTLQFIRDKLAMQGRLNYAGYMHDAADNQDWINQFSVEATNVAVDRPNCAVTFHWHTIAEGKVAQDFDTSLKFGHMQSFAVVSMADDLKRISADSGHPTWSARVDPPIWVLFAHRRDGVVNVTDFRDRDLADRVLRAMTHAAELCGGAKAEPF